MDQKLKQDLRIGPNIRKYRMQSHLTQDQVIAKMQLMGINISRSIYSQIESGIYNIRISELAAMKEIFNINYESFFDGIMLNHRNKQQQNNMNRPLVKRQTACSKHKG